jgi:hypothetical protein
MFLALTYFRLEKAVRISRPFYRMPKNAQNLHQPTYSHLHPGSMRNRWRPAPALSPAGEDVL